MILRHTTVYALLFFILAAADLATTLLALRAGATEFNPVLVDATTIDVRRFVVINALAGVLIVGMCVWTLANAHRADARYMASPGRAAFSWMTYVNPFSRSNVPKAVFHYAAVGLSLVLLRSFIVLNNLAIALHMPDPITPLAKTVGGIMDGSMAYAVTLSILIAPFWLIGLYCVPAVFRSVRRTSEEVPTLA